MAGPLVIAHRGGTRHYPENSAEAFAQAITLGADMLECDVRRTADGSLVLVHDDHFQVQCAGRNRTVRIHDMSLAELRQRLPWLLTFDDFLERFGRQIPFNLDLKRSGYEQEVLRALRRHQSVAMTLVSSGHVPSLRRLTGWEPALSGGLSRGGSLTNLPVGWPRRVMQIWLRATLPVLLVVSLRLAGAHNVMLQHEAISAGVVRRLNSHGIRVFAWTVDEAAEARRLASAGVAGIATNDLVYVMAALREPNPR